MDVENRLQKLQRIQKVDAPPFLFAKINHKLLNQYKEASAGFKWSFIAVAIILLIMNVGIISKLTQSQKANATESVINALSLSSSNDFYHEQN